METIEYGISIDGSDIDPKGGKLDTIDLGTVKHQMTKKEIEFVKKELPGLLKNGESLHLTTHVDHDEYFVVDVRRGENWPEGMNCEVMVMSYDEGCLQGGFSDWIDLGDESEINEFVELIFS